MRAPSSQSPWWRRRWRPRRRPGLQRQTPSRRNRALRQRFPPFQRPVVVERCSGCLNQVIGEQTMAWAFDTLGYAKRLRDGGVPNPQAEAHAEAAREFIMTELLTKQDLLLIKQDVLAVRQDLQETELRLK